MTAGSFNVSMLLTANAEQAKREVAALGATADKAGASVAGMGQKGATAESQIAALTAELAGLRTQLDATVLAEAKAVQQTTALAARMAELEARLGQGRGRGSGGAAGATANLIAQFNDVGLMLAAGQSPLLLAAQQGTQISQALGSSGAGGSVKALGTAFLGMLNPVNLAVFAAVAGLGLLGNALREVGGETKSLEDAFGDLDDATKTWQQQARVGTSDLERQFGTITPAIVDMQRQMTELALAETLLKAADAAEVLGQSLNPAFYSLSSRTGNIADLLGVDERVATDSRNPLAPQVEEFQGLLGTVASSENFDEQIAALDRMQEMIRGSATSYQDLTVEQREFLAGTVQLEQKLRMVQAAQEGIGSAQQIARAQGEKMLADLREEADLRQLTLRFGQNSVEVTEARAAAERRAFEAQLASRDIVGGLRDDLLSAWDAANGVDSGLKGWLASLLDASGASDETRRSVQEAWDAVTGAAGATDGWAGAMAGVAAEVRGIGSALSALGAAGIANASKQIEIEALRSGKSVAEARRTVLEAEIRREGELRSAQSENLAERWIVNAATQTRIHGVELDRQLEDERKAAGERERIATRSRAGGGGGRSRQTDGAERLILSLERELDLLRATDPVQKEMIRNREAMANATAAERAMIEELIIARERERAAQDQIKEAWEFSKNAAYDALDALIIQGATASDVMANLARTIAQALLQSALLGSGPLAGLFGGQGTGLLDIIGGVFGIPKNADGGMITGPGGPRDDKVLSWLSNGEFVVNAASAARHRPLLEQINSAPRFANGGSVGGAPFAGGVSQAGREPIEIFLTLTDDLDARVGKTAEGVSVRVMKGGLEQYDAKVLPARMAQIQSDPRRLG